jgi:hypothetical protein
MKKLILAFFLTASVTAALGQKIQFGLTGGYNIATQTTGGLRTVATTPFVSTDSRSGSTYGENLNHQTVSGFNAGAIMNIDFHNFTLQPGISYTTKGDKLPPQLASVIGEEAYIFPVTVYKLSYIEVSCMGLYNIHAAPNAVIHLGGGPYRAAGIAASYTFGGTRYAATFGNSHYIFYHYRNPDYGLNFIAGVELKKKILVDCSYSLGLANIATDGSTVKNRVMSISLGYLFR